MNLQEVSRFFITGHTGFKGTWLTLLLKELGFTVFGYSLKEPEFYLSSNIDLSSISNSTFDDIRNKTSLEQSMAKAQPEVVIHLAAQPLVLESYREPAMTFEVNAQGTVNLLEVASRIDSVRTILIVTTDKVYKNFNDGRRFKEDDCLFGADPYSCSKVAAEAAAKAWQVINDSNSNQKVIVASEGNVIGGGDLSTDRLIPDMIRDIRGESSLVIRNPKSTRPWQHVLEPLIGYLLYIDKSLKAVVPDVLNFGPLEPSMSVEQVLETAENYFDFDHIKFSDESDQYLESARLDLDSSLANSSLSWVPKWNQIDSIERTFSWWRSILIDQKDPLSACRADIVSRILI